MDASIGSDPNESQATQLLNDLLQNQTDSSRKQSDARSLKSRSVHSNEISSDSLPSPRHSDSLPQYHFHGLAATQTQSQHYEQQQEVNEGSQKENIEAQRSGKDAERPSPPVGSTSKGARGTESYTEFTVVHSHRGPANKKSSSPALLMQPPKKTPSFSPSKKPTTRSSSLKPQMSRFNPRPHSRSDSQDSFACDPSDKPEEQFLAKSDKFALPLSELGKHSSPTRGPSNDTVPSTYARDSQSPPTGRVLVEATPSHSGSSLNDEPHIIQKLEETQLVEDSRPKNRQVFDEMIVDKEGSGYESSEPSSSYHRFLDGDRDPDMQATQPSTQVDDSSSNVFAEEAIPWSNIRSVPPSSGPNSLMSMVDPRNRWRYRQHEKSGRAAQASDSPTSVRGSINRDAIPASSFPPLPSFPASKSFPPPNVSNSHNSPARVRPRPPSPVPPDTMDVVPDSEPVVEENVRPIMPRVQRHVQDTPLLPPNDSVVGEHDVHMDASDQLRNTVAQQEEEEEEEEEEIPLAALARKAPQNQAYGKRSTKSKTPVGNPPPNKASNMAAPAIPLPATKGKKATASASKPQSKAGRSWEHTVVPSSVPEQDIASEQRNLRKAKTEKPATPKGRPVKAPPPRSRNQRKSRRTPAPSTSNTKQESVVEESDDELLMRPSDCDGTEPADDEYILDEDDADSKKRKRSARAPASERNTRGATKRGKQNVQTLGTRSKRLRSALSTASRVNLEEATRVFALWKQDCHYYPGVVQSYAGNSEYLVKFDDDTEGWVTLDHMRLCRLRIGDDVLIANRFRPSRITNVRDEEGEVYVDLDGVDKALHISSIRIANKTILYDWSDRILSHDTIVPVVKPLKPHLSPSPSKLSMLSVPSSHGGRKKLLTRTGLIVTLTASKGNWEKEKEKVMSAVKNSGGIVVDDFNTIVRMEGKHSHSGNAWIIRKTDVEWIGDEDIERLFLVADEPNQKPKFLIALALGIPCLDTNWLRDSVEAGEEKDWLAYLLPQGHSPALDARPTQQVDIDWGNSSHYLTKIMSNAVPSKLFAEKSILCVGSGMVPLPKGRRKAGVEEKTQEAVNAVPRIILAMGAETVEAVTEFRYASKESHDYDYIIIREPLHYSPEFVGSTTVTWTWVKESLVASRCLPLPVWPSVEYSQEA